MNIALHGRTITKESAPYVREILKALQNFGVRLIISEKFQRELHRFRIPLQADTFLRGESLHEADFMFSLGGDGTLLETVTYVREAETPILGINTGRLGFLATTPKDGFTLALEALRRGQYTYDKRVLIHLDADRELFDGLNFGLNEFTILKKDSSSMIVVHAFLNGEFLNSYWADGLIVATPTGSTGYSLSCGGPLVIPGSTNFIITPVSPHNLYVRPMVVSDSSVISFEIEGRSKNFLVSLDSRSRTVDASVQMAVRKEDFCARLVKFNDYNFFDTLRQKLNWGWDNRN
jgi:NAD+ kinase